MKQTTSMTKGNIAFQLIRFAIPLILGNLFQQLYNTVDSIVLGKYVGTEALGAVGACDPPINIILGFSVGLSAGAGVLVARAFGAEDENRLTKTIHCIVALGGYTGVGLTALSMAFVPVFIHIAKLPKDVYNNVKIYLLIYFGGMFFQVVYNMLAGILNAVGNSKRTLMYLSITSILNIVLDLLFVMVFHWGIVGAAVATVFSEFVSMLMAWSFLTRCQEVYRIIWKQVAYDHNLAKEIITISVPTGVQNIVRAFANMIVQININTYGTAAMAGYAAYLKIDGLNWLPAMSLGVAAATFTGQNLGAKKLVRAKKGIRVSVIICIVYTTITAIFLLLFAKQIVGIFSADADVIHYGVLAIWIYTPLYFTYDIMQVLCGALQGAERTFQSMMVCIWSLCVYRIVWIIAINLLCPSYLSTVLVYPTSWIVGVLIAAYYLKKHRDVFEETV